MSFVRWQQGTSVLLGMLLFTACGTGSRGSTGPAINEKSAPAAQSGNGNGPAPSGNANSAADQGAANAAPTPPRTDGAPRITDADLQAEMEKNSVVVIDVRNQASFDAGHIKGARLIPAAEIGARVKELPRDKKIVTYCS